MVPERAAATIKQKRLFGYKAPAKDLQPVG
jgi:hypothetical protein